MKNYKPIKRHVTSPQLIAKDQMGYVPLYRAYNQGIKANRIEKIINDQIPIKVGNDIYRLLEIKNSLEFKTKAGSRLYIRGYKKGSNGNS